MISTHQHHLFSRSLWGRPTVYSYIAGLVSISAIIMGSSLVVDELPFFKAFSSWSLVTNFNLLLFFLHYKVYFNCLIIFKFFWTWTIKVTSYFSTNYFSIRRSTSSELRPHSSIQRSFESFNFISWIRFFFGN